MKKIFIFALFFSFVTSNTFADQKDPRLPKLFSNLLSVSPGTSSIILEKHIWNIWFENENEAITDLMKIGATETQSGEIQNALAAYTKVINQDPNYAEGWNQRALTHYLMGNYENSLSDIRRTLSLEPRHFGAISGQGLIYLAQHKWALAKKAFNRALKIHPTMRGPRQNLRFIENKDLDEEI